MGEELLVRQRRDYGAKIFNNLIYKEKPANKAEIEKIGQTARDWIKQDLLTEEEKDRASEGITNELEKYKRDLRL